MHTRDEANRQRGYLTLPTHGQDITRMEVIQWEAAGQPRSVCPTCRTWIRTGLDTCCRAVKKP